MIGLLALSLQAIVAEAATADAVMIASMTLQGDGLGEGEAAVAQRHASCISLPHFPLPDQVAAKRDDCRPAVRAKPSKQLASLLDRLDAIVREYPASEASLSVVKE